LLQYEAILLQYDTILLQNEAILLQYDTILLQNEAILLQYDTILLQNEPLLLQEEVLISENVTIQPIPHLFLIMPSNYIPANRCYTKITQILERSHRLLNCLSSV